MDNCYKKGPRWLRTQCSAVYISRVTAPDYDNSVETGYTEPELPCFIPVCRASAHVCRVYTWLFTCPAEWYLLTQRCVCMCVGLQNKSMWASLFGDNSLCICLCIIVVLWPQSLHDAGVFCLMRPIAGRFCAAVTQRSLSFWCLLFTQMWAAGIVCNMTEICFVWQEDSTMLCLLKTNSSTGRSSLLSK